MHLGDESEVRQVEEAPPWHPPVLALWHWRFKLQGVVMMRKKVLSLKASERKEADRRVATLASLC